MPNKRGATEEVAKLSRMKVGDLWEITFANDRTHKLPDEDILSVAHLKSFSRGHTLRRYGYRKLCYPEILHMLPSLLFGTRQGLRDWLEEKYRITNMTDGTISLTLEELSQLIEHASKPPPPPPSGLGNPGPLGLGGFALTTFVLSVFNAQILIDTSLEGVVLPLALFYGGIAQFIAGLYEFKIPNTFGATAFCSYGAFWCSFAGYVYFIVPTLNPSTANQATGLFLFVWLVFSFYMFFASLRVSVVLATVFGLLVVTFVLLTAGAFANDPTVTKAGGYFGIATAIAAWYGSAAVIINTTWDTVICPIGTFVQPAKKSERQPINFAGIHTTPMWLASKLNIPVPDKLRPHVPHVPHVHDVEKGKKNGHK